MSEFYKYIGKLVIDYLSQVSLISGDRYSIQFEKELEVKSLYSALREVAKNAEYNLSEFNYVTDGETYKSYTIDFNGVELIISATMDNIAEDFLTHLRNSIGKKDSIFEGKALLFIHDTNLDSIIGGSKRLESEGMPLHIKSIEANLIEKITKSELSKVDKEILTIYLKKSRDNFFEESSSIFDYRSIFEILEKKIIDKVDYKSLGMLIDSDLDKYQGNLEKRILNNMEIFKSVDEVHKYFDPSELEKQFDSKGVKELSSEDWHQTEFRNAESSKEKFKNESNPVYKFEDLKKDNEEICIWDIADGNSLAKARKRNIIIFNDNREESLNIKFRFDQTISKDDIKSQIGDLKSDSSGRVVTITLKEINEETKFFKWSYFKNEFKIVVLNINKSFFKGYEDKYNLDVMKNKYQCINLISKEDIILNRERNEVLEIEIDNKKEIELRSDELAYKVVKSNDDSSGENDDIEIVIKFLGVMIPLRLENDQISISKITSLDVWKQKREYQESFIYECTIDKKTNKESIKLLMKNRSYYPVGEFRASLKFEEMILKNNELFFFKNYDELLPCDIKVSEKLYNSYIRLIDYYRVNQLLPSLAYYDDELTNLVQDYTNQFFKEIGEIENLDVVDERYTNLSKVGTIVEKSGDKEILFTSLHPINLAYNLEVNKQLGYESINKGLLNRFNTTNLVPYYLNDHEEVFKPIDNELVEWTSYVNCNKSKFNSNKEYVQKIVGSKISEFIKHFDYLFKSRKSSLNISIVNLGDCSEVLKGVFDFYISELRSKKIEDLIPINIHICDDHNNYTVFEELSYYSDVEQIIDKFGINLKTKNYVEDDVLNAYRDLVHFYKVNHEDYQYSHLSFYKMEDRVDSGSIDMSEIETGLYLNGLISGVSSVFVNGDFITGFGTKNFKNRTVFTSNIQNYNSFIEYANKIAKFDSSTVIVTAINDKESERLNNIYSKSHWITFIDPKVDLNFFRNNEKTSDLLIIHYSDQYTSSSSYDAITVTRRSKQYIDVLSDFIKRNAIGQDKFDMTDIVNTFNVFNGEWLLRLISRQYSNDRDTYSKEKLSLISAIKCFESYMLDSEIIWIPLSLEEILRVSGGVGLSKGDSVFNPENFGSKGEFSDDILMVGIDIKDEINVYYYPVEVKIGVNDPSVMEKAKRQSVKTYKLFNESKIADNSIEGSIYRNLIIQLALIQVKKIQLYSLWTEKDWSKLSDESVVSKLMNDQFSVGKYLDSIIGQCGIIGFSKSNYNRSIDKKNYEDYQIGLFNLPLQDGYNYLNMSLLEIKDFNNWEYDNILQVDDVTSVYENEVQIICKDVDLGYEFLERVAENKTYKESAEIIFGGENTPDYISQSGENIKPFEEIKIIFGSDQVTKREVIWYPNSTDKVMHTNTGIIGTMGTGKTQFTKSLIAQLKREETNNVDGKKIGILIFDYKGDYIKDDFIEATGAKKYDLYELPFNPLGLFMPKVPKPLLPVHTANELRDTIANAFNLGTVQTNKLKTLILDAYDLKGISKNDSKTWDREPPTMNTVLDIFFSNEDLKEDSLYSVLSEIKDYELFEPDAKKTKSLFELIDGVTIINLSSYPESIQNLVVAITLDTFYAQMQADGHSKQDGVYRQINKMILVDEADNFLSKNFNSIKKILKEGREFGVGTILSTQFLKHFSTSENQYSQYILTWIIHKVSDISRTEAGNIFNIQGKSEQDALVNNIKNLQKHHSIINLGGDNEPKHIRDKAFWEL